MAIDYVQLWSSMKAALEAKNGRYTQRVGFGGGAKYSNVRMTPAEADAIKAFWLNTASRLYRAGWHGAVGETFLKVDSYVLGQLRKATSSYHTYIVQMTMNLLGEGYALPSSACPGDHTFNALFLGTTVNLTRWRCFFPNRRGGTADTDYLPAVDAALFLNATNKLVPALSSYQWGAENIETAGERMLSSLAESAKELPTTLWNAAKRVVPSLPDVRPWVQLLKWGTLAGLGGYIAYLLYKDSQKR